MAKIDFFNPPYVLEEDVLTKETSQFTKARQISDVCIRGEGGQLFVTNLCKNIGICTVLRYERGFWNFRDVNCGLPQKSIFEIQIWKNGWTISDLLEKR
jgi:hypothetical protein